MITLKQGRGAGLGCSLVEEQCLAPTASWVPGIKQIKVQTLKVFLSVEYDISQQSNGYPKHILCSFIKSKTWPTQEKPALCTWSYQHSSRTPKSTPIPFRKLTNLNLSLTRWEMMGRMKDLEIMFKRPESSDKKKQESGTTVLLKYLYRSVCNRGDGLIPAWMSCRSGFRGYGICHWS